MKRIKVLMLVPNLFVANGVASFVMNYLRNLNHEEVQVDIASYKKAIHDERVPVSFLRVIKFVQQDQTDNFLSQNDWQPYSL